jgi:hypothetical protein
VELKAELSPAIKVARRIAGHANAARGQELLWLFGVDEKSQSVSGIEPTEYADWWAQVRQQFDGVTPRVRECNVRYQGVTVLALLVTTESSPYVVRNSAHGHPGGGPVTLEVPWREMTQIRTATRADLLRVLRPVQDLPEVEVLSADLRAHRTMSSPSVQAGSQCPWSFVAVLYAVPADTRPLVFPQHKCSVAIKGLGDLEASPLRQEAFQGHSTIRIVDDTKDLTFEGPGRDKAIASLGPTTLESRQPPSIEARLALTSAGAERPIVLTIELERTADWVYQFQDTSIT